VDTVLSTQEMKLDVEDDIILTRRRVREIAEARRFDAFATAAITTAASELARNVLVHAGRGVATLEEVQNGTRIGIRLSFRDEGPGITDVQRVLAGGFSTARSMGLGLSGSRRLVDNFELSSEVGKGTTVTIVKWKRF
jgi:serine/threonine-protein kinase RsbT